MKINTLKNTYHFIPLFLRLSNKILFLGSKDARSIWKEANTILASYNLKPDEIYFKKIKYYTTGLRITNEWFSTLRGYKTSRNEDLAGMFFGGATPVFDAIFDELNLSYKEVIEYLNALDGKTSTDIQILFKVFFDKLHKQLSNKEDFNHYFDLVKTAQLESTRQTNSSIPVSELRKITFEKGGYSLLLCRSILDNPMKDNEKKAIYHLGALIQLANDLFDIYEDLDKNIITLPIALKDISAMKQEYLDLTNLTISLFKELDYPTKNIYRFLLQMMIIISRGFVCLDHFENLQKQNIVLFPPENLKRKQLICDMEKPYNLLKSIEYTIRWKYSC